MRAHGEGRPRPRGSRIFGHRPAAGVAVVLLVLGLSAAPAWALVSPVLSGTVLGQTSVRLDWTDGGDEQQYLVFRDGVQIATVTKNVLAYTNTGLSPGTTYQFRVDAKKGRNIAPSNVIPLTTETQPPPECSDGINNDPAEDSLIDFPADPGCTSSTDTTESPNPPPPGECTGVQVPFDATPGYLNTIIPGNGAQTYCLAAGTYEMGSTVPLAFDTGDVIVGQPVTFGPNGEVTAPTAIHGTASQGVIQAETGDNTLTLENLDICCSPGSGQNLIGRGIDGNASRLVNLTVRNSRIHGNGSNGISGMSQGFLLVENSEIDHNGNEATGGGIDAGIKVENYAEIRGTYFHDNAVNGMWWDCDAPGGIVENSTVDTSSRSGIFIEISSGDSGSGKSIPPGASYGFIIRNNHVEGNEYGSAVGHGGINVVSSRNVTVDGNTAINNGTADIRIANDSRSNNGHNGCSSGFNASNVTVQNNSYGPLDLIGCALTGVTCTNNTKIL